MLPVFCPKEILVTDTNNKTYSVSPLSFSDRERFRSLLSELLDIVQSEEDKNKSFYELYDQNVRVNSICSMIFELHNIDITKISSDLLFTFLFPTDDNDMGVLAQLNAIKPSSVERDSNKEVKDAYHSLLAQLVELTGSITEAVNAFTTVPAATLLSTMEALADIRKSADPEEQKRMLQNKAREKILEMQKNKQE